MTRLFIMLPEFEKQWAKMGLTDNDLKRLQYELLDNPKIGDVMQGTGGLRKVRFSFENRGKSGSARVVYVDFAVYEKFSLLPHIQKTKRIIYLRQNEMQLKS